MFLKAIKKLIRKNIQLEKTISYYETIAEYWKNQTEKARRERKEIMEECIDLNNRIKNAQGN